jgi:hypothetical protein
MSPSSSRAALDAGAPDRSWRPRFGSRLSPSPGTLSPKHIAIVGRLGSGPALGPPRGHQRKKVIR